MKTSWFKLTSASLSVFILTLLLSSQLFAIAPPAKGKNLTKSASFLAARRVERKVLFRSIGGAGTIDTRNVSNPRLIVLRVEFQPDNSPLTTGDGLMITTLEETRNIFELTEKYWKEVSCGKFQPSFNIGPLVRLSKEMSYYGKGYESVSKLCELAEDSIQASDPAVDFSSYDGIIIYHAGYGQESDVANNGQGDSPDDIWSAYIDTIRVTADGKEFYSALIAPELQSQDGNTQNGALGVLVHEMGHMFGLPDLYDTTLRSTGVGYWCLMGNGAWVDDGNTPSHLSPWCKNLLGFIEPLVVSDSISVSLRSSSSSTDILKIYTVSPEKPTEYFMVENRHREGFDAKLPGDGILIWHIDDTVGSIAANDINSDRTHKRVDVECATGLDANGLDHLDYYDTFHSLGEAGDLFKLDGNNRFDARSNPSSISYDGEHAPVSIRILDNPGPVMRVSVSSSGGKIVRELTISDAYAFPNPVRGTSVKIHYNLNFPASEAKIYIYSKSGKSVYEEPVPINYGENNWIWNLSNHTGNTVENGVYLYKIIAVDPEGREVITKGALAITR